jgi:uncharacterized protein (UPF0248 family)
MTPIHQLLARIRHDPQFGQGEFELGYLDRFDAEVHRIALGIVNFPEGEKRVFEFEDAAGQKRRIPFHRIREVYRDGALIWQRAIRPGE